MTPGPHRTSGSIYFSHHFDRKLAEKLDLSLHCGPSRGGTVWAQNSWVPRTRWLEFWWESLRTNIPHTRFRSHGRYKFGIFSLVRYQFASDICKQASNWWLRIFISCWNIRASSTSSSERVSGRARIASCRSRI